MSEYDQTFDPNILIGHCDLILGFSDFAFYLDNQLIYFHTSFRLRVSMDWTFDPNILIGHCDLFSQFTDFALSPHSIGIFSHFFQIMSEYDQTFDPNLLIGDVT